MKGKGFLGFLFDTTLILDAFTALYLSKIWILSWAHARPRIARIQCIVKIAMYLTSLMLNHQQDENRKGNKPWMSSKPKLKIKCLFGAENIDL